MKTGLARISAVATIGGSDSGGGAGVQADLKTFTAYGLHGTSVLTCVTAQNPRAVTGVQPVSVPMVIRQLEAVWSELTPAAAKTGMLYSRAIIRGVADFLRGWRGRLLVVDPVMVATSGARLLRPEAVACLRTQLLPLATVVTPNLDEAEILAGMRIRTPEDLRIAARRMFESYGCSVLVKGGHLKGPEAIDVFWDGREEWLLTAPRVRGVSTHGTGCTYSAAIAAGLAKGGAVSAALRTAKEFITQSIAGSRRVGRHPVLDSGRAGRRVYRGFGGDSAP